MSPAELALTLIGGGIVAAAFVGLVVSVYTRKQVFADYERAMRKRWSSAPDATLPADDVVELPEGQSYYGHRFVATVQGVVGCGPTPADAVNRALAHLHYRRDPHEWLAARRKRRAAR